MKILGLASGRAAPTKEDPTLRRPLADGGAALIVDGHPLCAVIEERFTRRRYSGGFAKSLPAVFDSTGIRLANIDAIAHSTCCDVQWDRPDDILDDLKESVPNLISGLSEKGILGRLYTVNHHDSHCALAFVGSGFDRALVIVSDGMGNRNGQPGVFNISPNWWEGAFQRHTCYLCEWKAGRLEMERVHEDAQMPGEIGLGEIYRAVTHALGWRSYQFAGKTMALAAFGDPLVYDRAKFVDHVPPFSIRVNSTNRYDNPVELVTEIMERAGYVIPEMGDEFFSRHFKIAANLAATLQSQVETALQKSVAALADSLDVENIAFAGGVAMNCVALGKLCSTMPGTGFYVPPAPSDTGIALGNALWLAHADESPVCQARRPTAISTAFLGLEYSAREIRDAIQSLIDQPEAFSVGFIEDDVELISQLITDLNKQHVIGLRRGRGEYGPRALGHSSILADPRSHSMHTKVNAYKKREPFRPFAPSILEEYVCEYLQIEVPSPFMSFASSIDPEKRWQIPAVTHIDGTARYQSVPKDGGFFRALLECWYNETGVPVLLNTSFNLAGEPIVEHPRDAVRSFLDSGLPVLVLGSWYVRNLASYGEVQ